MQTPPTTSEMAGVVKGGCHETRMVQRGPLDRASERSLRSFAGGRRIRQVAERAVANVRPRVRVQDGVDGNRAHARTVRVRARALCRAATGVANLGAQHLESRR